ncbi:DUF1697 domain-containing protein [Caenimonas koreensis]|uniref:DUF1697 domain-containing protein n=1 Tax=Caenimonas koreensis DSM 17982 TaxID=1121255 RepID=A0A844B0P6_9BURK|nr:DUF1697 domain-containing protein [Caenimonas koreensis]MRD46693.1 DUF1697 domain-containing protein [Caenimonas koreensis DSM 17982]
MPRYVAFLRGVSPLNLKMPELKACLEDAGFTQVKTLLSSGNAVFDARATTEAALEKKCEAAMHKSFGKAFHTIVRAQAELATLVESDPFAKFKLPDAAKRVVTFMRVAPAAKPKLPVELDGAQLLALQGRELLTAYVASDKGPVFMTLIEKNFGKDVTTRTWDTLKKCSVA